MNWIDERCDYLEIIINEIMDEVFTNWERLVNDYLARKVWSREHMIFIFNHKIQRANPPM